MLNEKVAYLIPYLYPFDGEKMLNKLLVKNVIGETSLVSCRRSELTECGKLMKNQWHYRIMNCGLG